MSATAGLALKLALSLVAAFAIWRAERGNRSQAAARRADRLLVGLAVVAVVAFVNFGSFNGTSVLHYGEMFHYVLGAKYFPELGYDGLYAASIEAERESMPGRPLPPETRDLRDKRIVATSSLATVCSEVRGRFLPERWRSFVTDHRVFLPRGSSTFLATVRLDHGFNPPPSWVFVGRLVTRWLPITRTTLSLVALIDPVLLAVAFLLLGRTYGIRLAAVTVLLFGVGFAWQYVWVSGAFLRYDWFATTIAAFCLARRERPVAAGAALGYAASVRLFPGLLLIPFAFVGLRRLRRHESLAPLVRLGAGFAVALSLMVALGCFAGRGVGAWSEFARTIEEQREAWATNDTGLRTLFVVGSDSLTSELPGSLPLAQRWEIWQERMNAAATATAPAFVATAVGLLLLAGAAAWWKDGDEVLAIGITAVFALLVLTCYYWVLLVLGALRGGRIFPVGLLCVNAVLCGLDILYTPSEVTFATMAWGLLALFTVWLAPAAWRTWRTWRLAR
jgi:hypothetical protein